MTATGAISTIPQVLRLEVDLGGMPELGVLALQVDHLHYLSYFSYLLAYDYLPANPSPLRAFDDMVVVRTSLASPWVTVLADATTTSAPVGYAVTGIYCLQRIMKMIMEWQVHRKRILGQGTEEYSGLARAERERHEMMHRIGNMRTELAQEVSKVGVVPTSHGHGPGADALIEKPQVLDRAATAAQGFGKIVDLAVMSENDPRARS